jgi:exosortase A-associated hydrolase 1
MRRLLSFECAGETLAASLDQAEGDTGLLMVTGGSQTRIGSHRMYERIAKSLCERGYSSFRYDRRGVGDSSGADPDFRDSGPDLATAAGAFRRECPQIRRVVGFGLCDGATAIALHGAAAGLDGLILLNPWLVEAETDTPPPAAIRRHYRDRLFSRAGWKKLLSGGVDLGKLLRGVRTIAAPASPSGLAAEAAGAIRASACPARLILAEGDATAIAADAELKAPAFRGLIAGREDVATDSHTFARPGDEAALTAAVVKALRALAD